MCVSHTTWKEICHNAGVYAFACLPTHSKKRCANHAPKQGLTRAGLQPRYPATQHTPPLSNTVNLPAAASGAGANSRGISAAWQQPQGGTSQAYDQKALEC